MGMELAGHECVGFCEFDKFATASYISMHLLTEEQRKTLEDIPIKKRQKEILKEEYRNGEWYANDIRRVYAGDIPKADCWCFGFPCQDISVAGKQAGFQGNRSSLFFRVMYLVGQLKEEDRPTYLFIENVKNLLSVNGGWDFARLLIEMEQWGYDAEWQVLNSKDFGVPQNRERCFIIGHLRGRSSAEVFPIKGTDRENNISIDECKANIKPPRFVDLCYEKTQTTDIARCLKARYYKGIANHAGQDSGVAIPVLTPDRTEKRQNGRRFKENGEPMFTLTSQDRHGVSTSLNPLGGLYTGVSKEFYRGIYEGCFRCLKASTHDSGVALKLNVLNINSNKGIFVKVSDELIVYAVWYEKYQCYIAIRKLTPKECFRLQGWSDDYFEKAQFVNSDSQLYKQAGNGVTVTVIEAMARKMNVNLN